MRTTFLRVLDVEVDHKAKVLARVIASNDGTNVRRFDVDPQEFCAIPRATFAYWSSKKLRAVYRNFDRFESSTRKARVGLQTSDDRRFVRLWFEPLISFHQTWAPFAKGGHYSLYYCDIPVVVRWSESGREIRAFAASYVRNDAFYFRPCITWPLRTSAFCPQLLPAGVITSVRGYGAHAPREELAAIATILGSSVFDYFFKMALGRFGHPEFVIGVLQTLPWVDLAQADQIEGASLVKTIWRQLRKLDCAIETSRAFVRPVFVGCRSSSLSDRYREECNSVSDASQQVERSRARIDTLTARAYGIEIEELRLAAENELDHDQDDPPTVHDDDEASPESSDIASHASSLMSWSFGVALGRFDIRLATGARPLPSDPDPFDPLPVCSPGMLTGDDGLPVAAPPSGYPLTFPPDGILVDDPGHPRDLLKAVRAVFDEIFDDANARWHEAAELVGARGGDLRDWFARSFFGEHIKRYRKSGRKAPIYWQLATASGSYAVWVYLHRATPDTLFRVLNDFVGPKLDHEREKLDRMTKDAGPNPSRADRNALDAQESFIDELQALRAELARLAPLWKPDLDDGVILNFAPLWRLVQQDRSWQAECRKTWDKLCAGEYDWAHLAMHLWPERAVLKCAKDRSLAIAHGLEAVFWRQDGGGNWHAVSVSAATVRKLIEERTSSSVKAALKDLLTAPGPTGKSGGRRSPSTPARTRAPRRTAPAMSALARTPTADVDDDVDEATLTVVRAAIASAAEGATKADVQATTGLSDADWNRSIAELLERGDVTRTGQKRGTRYYAVPRSER